MQVIRGPLGVSSRMYGWPQVFALLGFVATTCVPAPGEDEPQVAARTDVYRLRDAVERYRDSTGYLPDSLQDLCLSGVGDATCPYWPVGRRLLDSWGHTFHYDKTGSDDYVVIVKGPDGALDTPDDVRFQLSVERRWVHAAAGCYQLDGLHWEAFPGRLLTFDTVRVSPGRFKAHPAVLSYHGPSWHPLDSVAMTVDWLEIHHGVMFHLVRDSDSLIGAVRRGRAFGTYSDPRMDSRRFVAHKVACTPSH